jgi:hypothetical protein
MAFKLVKYSSVRLIGRLTGSIPAESGVVDECVLVDDTFVYQSSGFFILRDCIGRLCLYVSTKGNKKKNKNYVPHGND